MTDLITIQVVLQFKDLLSSSMVSVANQAKQAFMPLNTIVNSISKGLEKAANDVKDFSKKLESLKGGLNEPNKEVTELTIQLDKLKQGIVIPVSISNTAGKEIDKIAKPAKDSAGGGSSFFSSLLKGGGNMVGNLASSALSGSVNLVKGSIGLAEAKESKDAQANGIPASATTAGKISSLSKDIEGAKTQLGTALLPIVNKVLDAFEKMSGVLPKAVSALQPLINAISKAIEPVLDFLPTLAAQLPSVIGGISKLAMPLLGLIPVALNLVQAFMPLLDIFQSPAVQTFVNDIVGFVKVLAGALIPVINNLKPLFNTILSVGLSIAHHVFAALTPIIQKLSPIIKSISHTLSVVLSPALRIAGAVFNVIIDVVGKVTQKIMALLKPIISLAEKVGSFIGGVLNAVAGWMGAGDDSSVAAAKEAADKQKQAASAAVKPQNNADTDPVDTPLFAAETANTAQPAAVNPLVVQAAPLRTDTENTQERSAGRYSDSGNGAQSNSKTINININKPFIDNFTVNAQRVEQGLDGLKQRVEEILLEILNSVNAVQ